MKRRLVMIPIVAVAALLAGGLVAACKQGAGEVCQIDDDCESGLTCNAGTMQCQKPGSVQADAAPVDATAFDAAAIDGGFDAAPVDAAAIDAGP